MSERYKVQYSHRLCHPETCAHRDDWQLWDGNCCIEYFSTKEEAQAEADRLNNGGAVDSKEDEITALRQRAEKAEARLSVQHEALTDLAVELKDRGGLDKQLYQKIVGAIYDDADAWLLRKQAEAVEHAAYRVNVDLAAEAYTEDEAFFFRQCRDAMSGESQRLRQQADQIEAGQAGGTQ